jgi:hypothetical protein
MSGTEIKNRIDRITTARDITKAIEQHKEYKKQIKQEFCSDGVTPRRR